MSESLLITCPECGATNRVPSNRLAAARAGAGPAPSCGRCKAALPLKSAQQDTAPADSKPVTVTDATFDEKVGRSELPVLLDLWAPWCGPCRMIAPALDELAAELAGQVRIAKLNIDENPQTASRFGVASIPTLLILRDGREVDRIVGAQPKVAIAQRLQRVIG